MMQLRSTISTRGGPTLNHWNFRNDSACQNLRLPRCNPGDFVSLMWSTHQAFCGTLRSGVKTHHRTNEFEYSNTFSLKINMRKMIFALAVTTLCLPFKCHLRKRRVAVAPPQIKTSIAIDSTILSARPARDSNRSPLRTLQVRNLKSVPSPHST